MASIRRLGFSVKWNFTILTFLCLSFLSAYKIWCKNLISDRHMAKTRSALGRAHLPPTTVFRRLKTTRRCFDGCPVPVRGIFPDVIKFHVAVHTLWEKVIRFPHPDYNPDRAQKLISSSCPYTSVDTQHFIQIDARVFLVILHTDRQTDRQKNERGRAGKNIYLLRCRLEFTSSRDLVRRYNRVYWGWPQTAAACQVLR